MEEKVGNTLRVIDDGGDSFAQRAEMYYRKRPELINFVEESFRAYRALAERYDHLSRELQSANRTIATVYPERVHEFAMDVDDEENHSLTSTSSSSSSSDQSKRSIPKVPKIPNKDFRSPSMPISRKGSRLKRLASSSRSVKPAPSSGLTRTEALEEIDNVQKGILGLQTEKEFVKSMYEHGYQKFWEIENQITEMQKRVSSLQDEFGIQTVIEDDEARALMAATALKSCQDTLVKLQEKQDRSAEEARVEQHKIKDAHEKFSRIREKFLGKQTEGRKVESKEENLDEEIVGTEESNVKTLRENIKEKLDVSSKSSLTVTELAEKIDELVNKVVSLETEVSSQTALVKRLGSETDQLQANVRSLENDNDSLKKGSENMSKKLRELEEELRRVKILNQSFRVQNDNLQTHFTEASCNLDHLSEKLQSVKQDEEVEYSKPRKSRDEEEEKKDSSTVLDNSVENRTNPSNDPGFESVEVEEQKQEDVGEEKKELSDETREILEVENEGEEAGCQRNLRRLFLKGLEDREKILLEEYTSVLQDYKEVKKKLSEMENKNRDSIFELAVQIRELKSDIASKDEQLKSLKNKFEYPPQTNPDESPFTCSTEYKYPTSQEPSAESLSEIPPLHSDRDSISDELENQNVETLEKLMASADNLKGSNENDEDSGKMVNQKQAAKPHFVSPIIEKFRSDIDGLLEENLEFWLRFSTSVHQIQKFETSIEDLHLDLSKLKENHNKKPGGITGSKQHSILSDARPIYRHLREIQTEMSLWLEHNAVLKDELQGRFSSLCNIQDEISRVSGAGSEAENAGLSEYQAAKFQGEVLNMKQENNKVADELKVGLNRVKGFKVEVEKSLAKLNEELGISATKNDHSPIKHHPPRPRIPLRSFLFGVKLKRQKPSIFSCVSPALQKQYSDLATAGPLPT
ncbi:Protein Networked (NET), actin-binding (NAB) domain containing protein [Parasponia andersonii]|uniref:Protein Networked (NET), actin-binding (NAB) domain containing protein n=1 Tax=Parasponia andersonii TaxID=3476 RepID=A0A2P5BLV7_PARAD|nr:Protein Networked (NET), actin-binding (NAB) domain containing protein [Parasponia andersonii]